jgi:CMP-N-acetylneuraminic acid synthetase
MLPVIRNAVDYFEKIKKKKISKLVIFDPTSPLRTMNDIKIALKNFDKKKPDLLLSVHESGHNPYFSMLEKKGKYFKLSKNPNHDPGSRQEVPKVYEINTIVWIYSRKAIFSEKRRIPKKTLVFTTPINRSIDIDTKNDIDKINIYLKKYGK